jgi:hypothetical protein
MTMMKPTNARAGSPGKVALGVRHATAAARPAQRKDWSIRIAPRLPHKVGNPLGSDSGGSCGGGE